MTRIHKLVIAAAAALEVAALPVGSASAHRPPPTLVGRAIVPADESADGPPSGADVTPPFNGIEFPGPSQPVAGFSAIVAGANRVSTWPCPTTGSGARRIRATS